MMRWAPLFMIMACLGTGCQNSGDNAISFNRDIRPILNEKCMRCHGGVKALGGFNMLFEETAFAETESGKAAIVPGHHQQSELYRRITSDDPEIRMPFDGKALNPEEIDRIARWIDQGAKWEKHWAYIPPKDDIIPPDLSDAGRAGNEIDHFTFARLEQLGLQPNPEASRVSLLRRSYFDLTGLPPTQAEAKTFLEDQSPQAYEKLVDQLLASPHFGERWATMWLDLARYADTKGYEKDSNRSIWKFRDWVIRAFNEDIPFDQFTIEQLAGDLLDTPSESQLTATAFHRNSISNDEGGTDDEMFRVASVIERVGTTYEVWQATTMACVQCHSHPYDPFRHEEFYTSMALFNNSEDRDIYNEQPKLFTYSQENAGKVKDIIDWIKSRLPESQSASGSSDLYRQRSDLLYRLGYRVIEAEEYTRSSDLIELIWPDQDMLWQVQDSSWIYFEDVDLTEVEKIGFRCATPLQFAGTISIHLGSPQGPQIGTTRITRTGEWKGWQGDRPDEDHLFKEFICTIAPTGGRHDLYFKFGVGDTYIQHLFYLDKIIYYEKVAAKDRYGPNFQHTLYELASIPAFTTPIIRELPPKKARTTHIFNRGNWLTPGKEVEPGIPSVFAGNLEKTPGNRLEFAQWLVSLENPLTARVIVNRVWEQLFGTGLMTTMEEFGSQGAEPTHPELLDWLAVRLMHQHQWSLKSLIREIVMSATYRQDSSADAEKREKDPDNKWLSRGARTRLSAEQIRDQILALSGLLDRSVGGPGVILPELGISQNKIPSWAITGEKGQYRRSMYAFWKRTDPFPDMIIFDSPDRAQCSSQRIRTNTPLQALNLLNDEVYLEAAANIAENVFAANETPGKQIASAYEDLLFKPIDPERLSLLEELYQKTFEHYGRHPDDLHQLIPGTHFDNKEKCKIGALTVVVNALLNLDELVVKS